jgi:hypothetical protein
MIELINHTGIITDQAGYPAVQIIPAERSGLEARRDISNTSSKFVLDGYKIVFERYDRNGKLVSRVPWTAHRVSEKA